MKYLDSRLYAFAMVLACVLVSATLFSGYSQNTRDVEDYAMAEPFSSANYQVAPRPVKSIKRRYHCIKYI